MILLAAVAAGALIGLGWARWHRVRYEAPVLHFLWLAPIAFLLQIWRDAPVFFLSVSQILFIGFTALNRSHLGMKILLLGALLNFSVMTANHSLMPISPKTASSLVSEEVLQANFSIESRIGAKDILLSPEQTRFEWLADRFLLPAWFPYRAAFSLGDVFIAIGAFWLLAKQDRKKEDPA